MGLPATIVKLILVNDGTRRDLTHDIEQLNHLPITILTNKSNNGKGHAIRKALSISQADFVIFTDVDFPYTTNSLIKLFHTIQSKECDVALGIRDENYYDEIPASRKRISKMLKNLNRKLMNLITTDTQCGLKGMNHKGKSILQETNQNRYLIDLEFIKLLSKKEDLNVQLVIVKLREGVSFSKVSKSKIFKESLSYFKVLFAR